MTTTAPQRIGRFQIRRLLGKGAQSAVYLAFDPHLEREVAIKTLHFAGKDPTQNQALLAEARTVSKLRHAHIVPIFEAGEEDGDPYLVFEYVEGRTLAEQIRDDGPMEPNRAALILTHVLDAIAYAHRNNLIHRDLKPSNILIGPDGLARVMDFGIATRIGAPMQADGELWGTPAYLAPEYVNRHIVNPQGDVYAAGLVLYEMLFGRRAFQGRGVQEILSQVAGQAVEFPPEPALPAALQAILAAAVAREPERRYPGAQEMKDALDAYLHPATGQVEEKVNQSTLEFLLRRMRHKSDFPALSSAIGAINRLAASEKENVSTLSNSILKDFALTSKILRVVNSPYYRTVSGGTISTVSRAIVVLGFNTIRSIAISLMLFEHLQDKSHANLLKEEFVRANLCGVLAREAANKTGGEAEEAFICALFHNLGRLLTQYYFPEEADAIQRLLVAESCDEETAAARVLGLGYQDLGIGIARSWGFPDTLVYSMRRLPKGKLRAPEGRENRLRMLAGFAQETCALFENHPPERRSQELAKLRARFGEGIGLAMNERALLATLDRSAREITAFANIVRIDFKQTRIGRRLLAGGEALADASGKPTANVSASAASAADTDELPTVIAGIAGKAPAASDAPESVAFTGVDAQAILTAGIQDISNSLVEGFSLNDLLRMILETMYRAMEFRRVLMCVRDVKTNTMNARLGFGEDAEEVARRFRFSIGAPADVFNLVLSKGTDLLIRDAGEKKIAGGIPDWYRRNIAASTFLLLPLLIKNVPVGLIYADKALAGDILLTDKELSLLRTLRNQAVLAIKQSG